jgi:tetratricopeptide (TPR) repeat protein
VTGVRVITGPAGVGKSALARRLARQLAAEHPDGLLYVDLSGTAPGGAPLPPIAVLHRFLRTLGVAAGALPADLQEASAQFRSLVAARRILVVLDDAADAEQARPLLPGGRCGAIVTCRRPLALLDAAMHLTLAGLSEAAALELFERFAGPDRMRTDPPATAALIGWCGGLPLAVCLVGARLAAKPGWTVRQLADRLADARLRLDELRLGDTAIRTAFAVGYRGLREPTAAAVFRLLGLLDCPEVGGSVVAAMAEADVTPALNELVDAQLVEEPSPGRYRLHDLLRLFARERAEEQDAAEARHAAVYRGLRHYVVSAARASRLLQPEQLLAMVDDPDRGERFDDRAAAVSYLETERVNLLAAIGQAANGPDDHAALVPEFDKALFWFFRTRSYFLDWVGLGETAVAVARRLGDVTAEAQARHDLGTAYERAMHFPEATQNLTVALELRRAAGDRRGEAATLSSLGIVCWYRREYADAERHLEASLRVWRTLDGKLNEARTQNNLGLVHMSTGKTNAAERAYRAALKVFTEMNDPDGQLRTLGNLAEVEVAKGRFAAAERLVRRALVLAKEIGDPQSEAALLLDLGDICRNLGNTAAAVEYAEEALALFRLIELRWGEGDALRRLGAILAASGEDERALAHWQQALAVFSELGAPEADDVRVTLHSAQNRRATATVSVPEAFQSPANGLSPQQP